MNKKMKRIFYPPSQKVLRQAQDSEFIELPPTEVGGCHAQGRSALGGNAKRVSTEAVSTMRRIAAFIGDTVSAGGCFGGFRRRWSSYRRLVSARLLCSCLGALIIVSFALRTAFCLTAKTPQASAASGVTADEAIQLAFKHYPEVQQAEDAVRASRARVGERKSSYFPTLGIELQYTRLDPDPSLIFPGFGAVQLYPEDNYDGHLALNQILWDFGRTSTKVGAARYELAAAEKNANLVKMNLAYQTIQVYYAILLLQQSVDVQQQQIEALEEDLVFMQKKVASGSATNFDALTTRVKVEEAQNQKIELENSLNKEKIELCRLTGLCSSTFSLSEGYPSGSIGLDEDKFVSAALENRLEMLIAKDLENQALEAYKSAKTDNNPSLNLNILFGEKNGFFPDIQEIQPSFTGNVSLSLPVFTGLRTYNQVKEALAMLNLSTSKRIEVEELITAEVLKAVSDVRASLEKIKVTESGVKLAKEALGQAKVRYRSGLITNLDLLNADISLAQAQLLHYQALHDYALYVDALKKTAGIRFWASEGK